MEHHCLTGFLHCLNIPLLLHNVMMFLHPTWKQNSLLNNLILDVICLLIGWQCFVYQLCRLFIVHHIFGCYYFFIDKKIISHFFNKYLKNKWGMCPWDTDDAPVYISYKVIKEHNWRMVKMMLPKFVLHVSFVIISIMYKSHNIWLRLT